MHSQQRYQLLITTVCDQEMSSERIVACSGPVIAHTIFIYYVVLLKVENDKNWSLRNKYALVVRGGAAENFGDFEYHWDLQLPVAPSQNQPVC